MIDLSLTSLQSELVDSVRSAAAKEFPLSDGVAAATGGPADFDAARWARVAQLGWFGIGIAEAHGGVGLGAADELLVLLELGRVAAAGPIVGTFLAARIAADAGDGDLARTLVAGERVAGIVIANRVVDALTGDLAVRITDGHAEIMTVDDATPAVAADPLARVSRLNVASTVAEVDDPLLRARLLLLAGAYLVGVADAVTQMSVDYVQTREQFGRPIGSFQAIKHRCAEMTIRAYPARAQLAVGAVLLDGGETTAARDAIAAGHLLAAEAARHNTEDNVQNHGGIGFTAEHPAGVFVTRAQTYAALAGPRRDLVAAVLTTGARR